MAEEDSVSASGPIRAAKDSRTDWQTPPDLFNLLDREFHFTIDAAASSENHLCKRYLTKEQDALHTELRGEIVFCNPPYGRGLEDWVGAFWKWRGTGSTVVALLPAATDTSWFHLLCKGASEIRLLTGRVAFVSPTGKQSTNTSESVVAVYRPRSPQVQPSIYAWNWRLHL
jgi:phage N-6-adenine-methyltransferase